MTNTENIEFSASNVLEINDRVSIPMAQLQFRFSRSGGRGGQNVNKVETKVELLFDLKRSLAFSQSEKDMLLHRLRTRLDSDGILHVVADGSRSQWKNRQEALERFAEVLKKSLAIQKRRIPTKKSAASRERRITEKKRRGEIKRMRSGGW
jgi:ribosome-associated protein